MNRYQRLRQIEQLDPVTEYHKICYLLIGYEFPWDINRSLELAMLKTFGIPSISGLLDRTGQFYHHTQKRYDDTAILVAEIFKHYNNSRGQAALERMNKIHSHYPISNEDFLYVMSTFIYEPIYWNEQFGWRKMIEVERLAIFYFWREVGMKMNIKNIPSSYIELEQFYHQYEKENFIYADTNQQVSQATINLFLSWFPGILRPILLPASTALFSKRMIESFGLKNPSPFWRWLAIIILKTRGYLQHLLLPRKQTDFFIDNPIRSYPHGYQLTDIGPDSMLEKLNRTMKLLEKQQE